MLARRLARPMLSSIFVVAGFNTLRNPDRVAPTAHKFLEKVKTQLPQPIAGVVPTDGTTAVRLNAGVQFVAGLLLATGRSPRLASLTLAAGLVPTTLAGHAFWTFDDPATRARQQTQFLKNLSMMGGLLVAATDAV